MASSSKSEVMWLAFYQEGKRVGYGEHQLSLPESLAPTPGNLVKAVEMALLSRHMVPA